MLIHFTCTILALQTTTNYGMKYAREVWKMVEAGEEKPIQGLLEQWLREGRMSETEAVMSSTSMFAAGVDSVSFHSSKTGAISVSIVLDIAS